MSGASLLLIRHAESSWNATGRWQGHGDPPLSERGVEQAGALARELAREAIDVIVSSDLRRAAETAAILARARGLQPLSNARLRELDLGDWEGLTRDQIASSAGDVLQRFDAGDLDVRPGGGESLREIGWRARAAVTELVGAHPGRSLAIVTHLGVIRALCAGEGVGNACWRRLELARLCEPAARESVARVR